MAKLNIGDKAPDFTGITDSGEELKLQDYQGKILVLFFYPAAESVGCTTQACSFRDVYDEFLDLGAEVVGISIDSQEKQSGFKTNRRLQYPLIADTSREITKIYGGTGILGKANRYTFLIDKDGIIRKIWKLTGLFVQMKLGSHAEDVKKHIMELEKAD
ncbi:MAG: peroxiredoxin [Candidatus Hodarchaeales archaeon]|jgi:peroxiredoxin Q/BCP